jgi:hypothetical protein
MCLSFQIAVNAGLSIFEYVSLSGNETPDSSMSSSARTMNAVDIRSAFGFLCLKSSNVRESTTIVQCEGIKLTSIGIIDRISKFKTFHFGSLISCHINSNHFVLLIRQEEIFHVFSAHFHRKWMIVRLG